MVTYLADQQLRQETRPGDGSHLHRVMASTVKRERDPGYSKVRALSRPIRAARSACTRVSQDP